MGSRSGDFLKIALGLAAILAGSGIGYHYAFYMPRAHEEAVKAKAAADFEAQAEKQKAQFERASEEARKSKRLAANREKYKLCLSNAKHALDTSWDFICHKLDMDDDCALPEVSALSLKANKERSEDLCIDEYKAGT